MECPICIEKYNKSILSKVVCDFCKFECCKSCWKKYLMDTYEDLHCMNCKKPWSRQITIEKFGKTFVDKQYKKRREDVLYEREKGMFPATQPYIEKELQSEELDKEIYQIDKQIRELTYLKNSLREQKYIFDNKKEVDKKLFIRPCSLNGCKGFLSSQWKCGICKNYTCNDCLENIGQSKNNDEHKCDPNNIETAKMLLNETKPCPKCGSRIFKIEGCDQMFCTACHTPFSWKTGKIEQGRIHNPHYFEWLKNENKTERPMGEILCGRDVDHNFVSRIRRLCGYIARKNFLGEKLLYILENSQRLIHMREVELPRWNTDRLRENLALRISFMRNKITEDNFKITIQKREKEREKKNDISNVINLFLSCSVDILYRFLSEIEKNDYRKLVTENPFYDELEKLRLYCNNCFENISSFYNCKIYRIEKNWIFH